MRSARFEQLLAGTAAALALALTSPLSARAESEPAFVVPMPPGTDLPPPTLKDVTPAEDAAAAPAADPKAPAPAAAAAPAAAPSPATDTAHSEPAAAPATAEAARSEPAASPAPAGAVANTVADRLREQFAAGKFDRILGGSKKERADIQAFYAGRDFAPLWIADGALSERGKAAARYLAGVDADGLDPSEYPTPQLNAGADADAQAEAEIRFTDAVLTYAHHALDGRVHYTRVSGDIIYDLPKVEPEAVLGKLAQASDVAAALDSFEPQNPYYKALKAKLAEARQSKDDPAKARIASGPVLKYRKDKKGREILMEDPRVPELRERLGVAGSGTTYDKALADAVAKFQKSHRLRPTGQLNAATLEAINGPKREKTVDIIIANLERWRWVPRDLGTTYVMVNIPDYTLRVVHDGKQVWKTKIVVGKPNLPTPLLTAEMKYITVNPTWNVPPSIIQNEYLPALQQDPLAMERIGLKVEQNRDGTIRIYQPPGDRNALGRIRFNFPNKFLVYQHDTPDKYLFAHDKRAYSHGCMRVENPLKYGEVLLSLALPNEHYSAERLQKMFGGSEVNINFPKSLPVHLTYQTAFVDDAGHLQIRDDVYGRDQRLLAILNGADRKVADIAIERPKGSSTAPVKMPPGFVGGANNSGGFFSGGPGAFFERLFGGGGEPAPPRPRARTSRSGDHRAAR